MSCIVTQFDVKALEFAAFVFHVWGNRLDLTWDQAPLWGKGKKWATGKKSAS